MSIDVAVREVGTRDGLQSINQTLSTANKVEWCRAEAKAGVTEIEVSSFVSPRAIPQLADAPEVTKEALAIDGLTVAVLVPNLKGAERAFETGAHKLNYVLSVSESHNLRNVNRTVDQSFAEFAEIAKRRGDLPIERRPRLAGYLATAFGCTIEGAVSEKRVVELAERYAALGEADRAAEAQRQRVATRHLCAKARQEYAEFRPADDYARDFYERNVFPVACRAEPAADLTERMASQEERIAAQVELLQASAQVFAKLTGVSNRCAGLHARLELEKFKADHGWRPLLTDDQMTDYFAASTSVCPSEHVILE